MSKNDSNVHHNFKYPVLFDFDDLIKGLIDREFFILTEELWMSILSLRLELKKIITNIISEWKSNETLYNNKLYSFSNIIEWTSCEVFRNIFLEFINYKNINKSDTYYENSCLVYIRLVYENTKHEKLTNIKKEFTQNVNLELGNEFNKLVENSTVNCYLGILSGSTSCSRRFPRYEISIYHDKCFSDGIDKIIKSVSEFYFSNVSYFLSKQLTNNILKLKYYRKEKITIPKSFLVNINKKIEVIVTASDESYDVLEYENKKITKEFMIELTHNVAKDYIDILYKGDIDRYNIMMEYTQNSEQRINNELNKCCNKKDK